jgi:iron(III) transport system ATP-binding protein
MTSVVIDHLSKRFGDVVALDDISLSIAAGELFFLLGPSGCGKSTLLRTIAGLQDASSGRILFNDRDVTALPTAKRNAVMCFQSYALWPHMSVRENVAFGLETRGVAREKRAKRVEDVLRLVRLEKLGDRKPNELSGGQQQRVALARAMIVEPDCLLLDEPLSNLDATLRLEMRSEIRRICKTAGFTTIYVTHDQREALSVADRIALLRGGKLAQVGTPDELYHRPNSSFVAQFVGQTNLIDGEIVERGAEVMRVSTPFGILSATTRVRNPSPSPGNPGEGSGEGDLERREPLISGRALTPALSQSTGRGGEEGGAKPAASLPDKVIVSIRPERLRVVREAGDSASGTNRIEAKVMETTFLGESSEISLLAGGQKLKMLSATPLFGASGELTIEVDPADVILLKD